MRNFRQVTSTATPATTNSKIPQLHSLSTIPRANPAAGGCSVFVMSIENIANPTAKAPPQERAENESISRYSVNKKHIPVPNTPARIPIKYPPRTKRDLANFLWGIVMQIKLVAPRDAIKDDCFCTSRADSKQPTAATAKQHCIK